MRIDWVFVAGEASESIRVGDRLSAEAGGLPVYRVLRLEDGRAWLRDEEHGDDMISPLSRFRWKADQPTP